MTRPRPRRMHAVEALEARRLLSHATPVGAEFQLNTFTTGGQAVPAVALDADGDFVVAWHSMDQDGSHYGVYARRYSATGSSLGEEFLVNTHTTGLQGDASVAMSPQGDFVVAWTSVFQDGSSTGVYARRFSPAGVPQGPEFRVNTYTTFTQARPSVAMDHAGNFVVAWNSLNQDGSSYGVYAQRYNAAGEPLAAEFRVNTYTADDQAFPSVAMDDAGNFVIAWHSEGDDGSDFGIYAQRYNAAGDPRGGEFRVNDYTSDDQRQPSVAMDAEGDFVVVWRSDNQGGPGVAIYGKRFEANGAPKGVEFRADSHTENQDFPTVAMDSTGGFVVAWHNSGQDGSERGAYAQRFDSAGIAQGGEFRVNTYTTDNQAHPSIGIDADGDFVVAWHSGDQDGSNYGIYAQRYGIVPTVAASSFHFATAPHTLNFTFDRDVSTSLGTDDLVVQNLTTMQTVPAGEFGLSYDAETNVATFTFTGTTSGISGMLPDGNYSATLVALGVTTIQGAPLAADHERAFRFLQADADNDGRVNQNDFDVLATNFGQSNRDFTQGDFDYTGNVNLDDFNFLAARFGAIVRFGALARQAGLPSASTVSAIAAEDPLTQLLR